MKLDHLHISNLNICLHVNLIIGGISKWDHIRNSDIRKRLRGQREVTDVMQEKRVKLFGHINRMEPQRLPYMALYGSRRKKNMGTTEEEVVGQHKRRLSKSWNRFGHGNKTNARS